MQSPKSNSRYTLMGYEPKHYENDNCPSIGPHFHLCSSAHFVNLTQTWPPRPVQTASSLLSISLRPATIHFPSAIQYPFNISHPPFPFHFRHLHFQFISAILHFQFISAISISISFPPSPFPVHFRHPPFPVHFRHPPFPVHFRHPPCRPLPFPLYTHINNSGPEDGECTHASHNIRQIKDR